MRPPSFTLLSNLIDHRHVNIQKRKRIFSDGGLLVVANNEEINDWVAKQGNGAQKWIGATDEVIYDMTLG